MRLWVGEGHFASESTPTRKDRRLVHTMSTRKLILTALVCGLAIILAGGFKLFQVASDRTKVEVLSLGTTATLGDMTVSVDKIASSAEATLVTVTMVGVTTASGASDSWRLLADGRVFSPVNRVGAENGCDTVAAEVATTCVVEFDPTDTTPTVAYLRAGNQQQWGAGN